MNFAAAIQAAIGADVSGVQTGATQVESLAGKMNAALGQIGVGLSFGVVTAFFAKVADHAGKVQDLADRVNVSTDSLQAFGYHAQQAGVDADGAAVLWDKAGKAVSQLAAGQEAATKAFAVLGLAQKDLMGLPLDQQVEKIAKAYTNAKDKAGAYDAVTDILGAKTAPKLLAVIDQLASQGLPAFTQAARDAGQVIDGDTIAKLDELGDRMATLKGAATTAGAVVLNAFVKFGEGIGYAAANVANKFDGIKTNWDVAAEKAKKSAGEQVNAMTKIVAKADVLKRMTEEEFDRTTSLMPVKQRINALELQAIELRREATNAGKGSAEWAEKEARARKLFFEAEKLATEEKKKQNMTADEQVEISRLQVKIVAGTLTIAERARLDILKLQTKQIGIQAELAPLQEKGYQNLTREEKIRFDHLVEQSGQIDKQIKGKQDLIAATKTQNVVEEKVAETIKGYVEEWEGFKLSVGSFGRGDRDLSERELARKERNIRADISSREIQNQGRNPFDPFLSQQRYNLAQLQAEEKLRHDVMRDVAAFGPDRAFQMHSGLSEQRFAEILRQATDSGTLVAEIKGLRADLLNGRTNIGTTPRERPTT